MPASRLIPFVLETLGPGLSKPTWSKALTLTLGTLLARGRRTVAAARRRMDLYNGPCLSSHDQVINRAAWSQLRLARRLPAAAIASLVPPGVGWWGHNIRIRGHSRDPLASSKERSVAASGIRWSVLMPVFTPP